ncbi:MAG: hypothetical protein Q9221_006396 [Calogaya cf. arnoldii]
MLKTMTSVIVVLAAFFSQAGAAPTTASQAFVTNDGLLFGGFGYRSDGVRQLVDGTGLPPLMPVTSSSPNKIGFRGNTQPNITAQYPNSKVKSYRLTSTFIACVASSNTVADALPPVGGIKPPSVGVPEPCEMKFTAITTKGTTESQTCSFSGTSLNPYYRPCFFDQTKFSDVVTVVVTLESSLTLPETTTRSLDDVAHTNNY